MLRKVPTGTWLPAFVPRSTAMLSMLLMACSMAVSISSGVYRSMLNGLNILPAYRSYFNLDDTTTGLNTAAIFIGGCLAATCSGFLADRIGRRPAIFWGCIISLGGTVLQSFSRNIEMFIVARILIGFGSSLGNIASGTYLSETFLSTWRAWGVSMLNNFFYVGALLIAAVTLATSSWDSAWAWRTPSIVQGIFSITCIGILPFVPESPRWLIHQDHCEAARLTVALVASDGDVSDPVSGALYNQIVRGLEWEHSHKRDTSFLGLLKDPVARRRIFIGASAGPFSAVAGNVIATYYLGTELKTAGITDTMAQLKANIVLNAWCLPCALAGTHLTSQWGRKGTAIVTEILLVVYADDPTNATTGLVYGNVAVMFLFQGIYSIAWTPLFSLYPPEIANYSLRANTVALAQFGQSLLALIFVVVMPIGLSSIGWKLYIINASWDVAIVAIIWYCWVETKGKTLEEIDAIFDHEIQPLGAVIETQHEGNAAADVRVIEKPT
ncbi:MFS general substrate transporter [Thozetella sp. PMI_491]|nr:MFS general substrate transporter [Thozetella sp. PMI_491]